MIGRNILGLCAKTLLKNIATYFFISSFECCVYFYVLVYTKDFFSSLHFIVLLIRCTVFQMDLHP